VSAAEDATPISAAEAATLFDDLHSAPALVIAVSGGPDSTALLVLAARWRAARKQGPALLAVTVDHGLRPESAREARAVKRLAGKLGIRHRTLRWTGSKPTTALQEEARHVRYQLLAAAARGAGAPCVLTAHTLDDQAETVLLRMARGSGIAGLAAMARQSRRDGVVLARPLLHIPKARLVATLKKARIGFADDPTNRDASFTRPRLRAIMPALAAEGCDARNLARLASRLARANAALELLVDGAERYLALKSKDGPRAGFDAALFAAMPEEIRLRLLKRVIDRTGHEGPAELGKVETLLVALDLALGEREPKLKQTLAGAVISVAGGRVWAAGLGATTPPTVTALTWLYQRAECVGRPQCRAGHWPGT